MKFKAVKDFVEKYRLMVRITLASFVGFYLILIAGVALTPKIKVLFPNIPNFFILLHFLAFYFLWVLLLFRIMRDNTKKRLHYEFVVFISSFCEKTYDHLGDLIDVSDNTKKIKRVLNQVYTINFFICDKLHKDNLYVNEFKEQFARLTDETVVVIGMIEAGRDISDNRVDDILEKIDELKYLLHERAEKIKGEL